jgi:hypothetical protein
MPSQNPKSLSQQPEPTPREDRNAPLADGLSGIQVPDITGRAFASDAGRGSVLKDGAHEDRTMDNKPNLPQAEERAAAERLIVESRSPDGTRILQVVDARGYIARSVGIMGLVGVALIHLLDSGSKFGETPYVFWMYVGLMVASLGVAGLLLHTESWRTWALAGGLAGVTILGYVLSRTTGLPGATKDVGNWSEPLGLASLLIEGCIVALALYRVFMMRPAQMGHNQVR